MTRSKRRRCCYEDAEDDYCELAEQRHCCRLCDCVVVPAFRRDFLPPFAPVYPRHIGVKNNSMADIDNDDVVQHPPAETAAAVIVAKTKKPKSEAWHAARKRRANITFLQHIETLKSYKETHGHTNVKLEENPALHALCSRLRDARRKVEQGTWKTSRDLTVDDDRIALLDAIGFDWTYGVNNTKKGSFDRRITELINFKTKHGHMHITAKDKEKSLYQFCINIRNNRTENRLDEDKIAALDAIDFIWNVKRYQRQVAAAAAAEADKQSQQPTRTIAELAAAASAANSAASLVAGSWTVGNINTTATIAAATTTTALTTLSTVTKGVSIYWSSSEAAKLFGFPMGTNVYRSLQDRIDLLEEATLSVNGYKQLLLSSNNEQPMSEKQIFKFRHKCLFLRTSYQIAIEKMGVVHNNFKKACCEAVTVLNSLGFVTATSANIILEWNKDFRSNNGKFSHPNNKMSSIGSSAKSPNKGDYNTTTIPEASSSSLKLRSSSKMESGQKDDNDDDDTTNTLPEALSRNDNESNNHNGLPAELEEAKKELLKQDVVNKKRKATNIERSI